MFKNNPLFYLFSKAWKYSEGNRPKVALYYVLFVIAGSIDLFLHPFIAAKMINIVQESGLRDLKNLCLYASLPIAVDVLFWFLHGPARVMENVNAFKVRANYRKHLLKGIITLPLEWHAEHHTGDTIDKIEKGTNAIFKFSTDSFDVVYSILQMVGSFAMLAYFCHWSTPIVLVMMLLSVWVTTRFDRVMIPQYKELNHAENKVSESTADTLANISTVIILRVERLVYSAIIRKIESTEALFRRNNVLNESKWFITNWLTSIMSAIVLILYFWLGWKRQETILVGSVFILHRYLSSMGQVFFRFTSMYSDVIIRKTRVLNAEELANDFRNESLTNHVLPSSWKELEVRNLNFSYHSEKGELHLEDVNLKMVRGERIAFVGESGSGKTTMLKVMRDLYHPHSLALSVDGDVLPKGFEGISRAISLVPQNPEIFSTTILDNITLGAEYEMDFVRKFTDMACFSTVVDSLPSKFDSSIKEKGVNLSGGQQQRLALSRGLLACHDKDIVLLDEPTASIDTMNEMQIYQNIFSGFKGKTIISTIHRPHLLPLFDRIYMFHEGRIIGSGHISELLLTCPRFQELWKKYSENLQPSLEE